MGRYSERCAQAKICVTQKELTPKEKEELEKKKRKDTLAKVAVILRKCETLRTPDETRFLEQCSDTVKKITDRRERREIYKERVQEKEDPLPVLEAKARKLADAIRRAKHLICYTGAGISTSAKIPDYRGSNGIWTLLAQGKSIGQHDLSLAEPTFTHMALFELHRRKMLRFVVSQNCDGLHLRSGLPRYSLSEVHGNMYVEACKECKPNVEYWRLFDTTELTARYNHKTNRRCHLCGGPLVDTIVHFGERGSLKWPLNWAGACKQSEETDCILCLGSSLKVLKKYSWLWAMDRPVKKRPKLFIVNLQWTPKDSVAALKVNGKCDDVMRLVMQYLDIEVPAYRREKDPIFVHASMLCPEELHTVSQPMLKAQMDGVSGAQGESVCRGESVTEGEEEEEEEERDIKPEAATEPRRSPVSVMDLQKRLNRFEEEFKIETAPEEPSIMGCMASDSMAIKGEPEEEKTRGAPEQKEPRVKDEPTDYLSKFMEKKRELEMSAPSTSSHHAPAQMAKDEEENETKAKITEAIKTLYKTEPSPPRPVEEMEVRSLLASGIFGQFPGCSSSSTNYEDLLCIYKSLESTLPHWNNPKYAYSGLHSILLPPPPELNLWGSVVIPIIQPKVDKRRPPPPECSFCFEHYSERVCQFYEPKKTEFLKVRERNGRPVVCECCDHSEAEEEEEEEEDEEKGHTVAGDGGDNGTRKVFRKAQDESGEPDDGRTRRRTSNELNEISNNFNRNEGEVVEAVGIQPAQKVPKIDGEEMMMQNGGEHQKENGTVTKAAVVQAGWYGKGYRKYRQRRRKS